ERVGADRPHELHREPFELARGDLPRPTTVASIRHAKRGVARAGGLKLHDRRVLRAGRLLVDERRQTMSRTDGRGDSREVRGPWVRLEDHNAAADRADDVAGEVPLALYGGLDDLDVAVGWTHFVGPRAANRDDAVDALRNLEAPGHLGDRASPTV